MLSFAYRLSDHPQDVIDLICDRASTYFAENILKEFQHDASECYRQTHLIVYNIDQYIRKVKAEKIETDVPEEETFNIQNQYLSVCFHDCSDFILSRMYVVREVSSHYMAFICPDTVTSYGHSANNDPVRYVICNPCRDHFFGPLVKIIQTLSHHHKILITRLYSSKICLTEIDSTLEGRLVLDVCSDNHDIFSIIKEIEQFKLQTIFFTDLKLYSSKIKVDVRCLEQVVRWLRLSPDIKALRFDGFKLPGWLIEHMAQELYVEAELHISGVTPSNVTTVTTLTEQDAKDSSLQLLSFVYNSKSTQDIKTLVRFNNLPQLKMLHLEGFDTLCLGVLLGSGSPSLEKLSLRNVILSEQDINTLLNMLTKGGFPKLNCLNLDNIESEYVEMSPPDTKPLIKYDPQISQKLAVWNYRNEVIEAYLAVQKDILSKTKLNEVDTGSLIRRMFPTFRKLLETQITHWLHG